MYVDLQTFHQSVRVLVDFFFAIEGRIRVMNNAVVVGADDELVGCVIIEASYEINDVVSFDW